MNQQFAPLQSNPLPDTDDSLPMAKDEVGRDEVAKDEMTTDEAGKTERDQEEPGQQGMLQDEATLEDTPPEAGLDLDIARGTEAAGRDADLEATDSDVAQDPLSGAIARD